MRLLDATEAVLRTAGKAMRTKEIISALKAMGLWQTRNGKTPHATLYTMLLKDMESDTSRFERVSPGMFSLKQERPHSEELEDHCSSEPAGFGLFDGDALGEADSRAHMQWQHGYNDGSFVRVGMATGIGRNDDDSGNRRYSAFVSQRHFDVLKGYPSDLSDFYNGFYTVSELAYSIVSGLGVNSFQRDMFQNDTNCAYKEGFIRGVVENAERNKGSVG